MIIGEGYTDRFLNRSEIREILIEALDSIDVDGQRLLVILPDNTRSGPIPLCFELLTELLLDRVAKLDMLIALGTHMPMDEKKICKQLDITPAQLHGEYAAVNIYNHNWEEGLREIGVIPASEVRKLTDGLMEEEVRVEINERLFDYDRVIICGPVFPHEIAGFSGGNKYFFPGVSGPDMINMTHWLGALVTNVNTIGFQDTAVRRMLDRAASLITIPKSCFAMVVGVGRHASHEDLAGLYFGSPEEAQAAAAALSAEVNITYVDRSFHTVISIMPPLYDDIWTASKGMYKVEPVVADGGRVIIYAPHVDEISYTHGEILDRVGYHVRDYYLVHGHLCEEEPRSVLAHSTLVKGAGTCIDGVEVPRVEVILATGVPKERCEQVNLGYMDPTTINPQEWMGREEEGILVVPRAGEVLYRLQEDKAKQ